MEVFAELLFRAPAKCRDFGRHQQSCRLGRGCLGNSRHAWHAVAGLRLCFRTAKTFNYSQSIIMHSRRTKYVFRFCARMAHAYSSPLYRQWACGTHSSWHWSDLKHGSVEAGFASGCWFESSRVFGLFFFFIFLQKKIKLPNIILLTHIAHRPRLIPSLFQHVGHSPLLHGKGARKGLEAADLNKTLLTLRCISGHQPIDGGMCHPR